MPYGHRSSSTGNTAYDAVQYSKSTESVSYERSSEIITPVTRGAGQPTWTLRRVTMFALLALVYFLTYTCVSIISTFFTDEAQKMGVDDTTTGFIFGTYPLVAFVSALIFGVYIIPRWGPNFCLLTGLFLNGAAQIIFGFVTLLPRGSTFVVFCFVIRAVCALGGSACSNCVLVILIGEFNENVPTIVSALEFFSGCAFMLGPVMGGGLYETGGFRLPFLVMGSVLLLSVPPIWYFLPNDDASMVTPRRQRSYQALLIPGVMFMGFVLMISTSLFTFLDPTLAPFAEQLGLDATKAGLLFLVVFLAYAIFTPFAGWLCEQTGAFRVCIMASSLLFGLGLLLLGPAPFLNSFIPQKQIWLICVSLFMCGSAGTLSFVPSIPEMQRCCQEKGFSNDLFTASQLSGVFTGGANLGGFAGPVLGGALVDKLGFEWMATIMAFISFGQFVILIIYEIIIKLLRSSQSAFDERQPLLGANDTKGRTTLTRRGSTGGSRRGSTRDSRRAPTPV